MEQLEKIRTSAMMGAIKLGKWIAKPFYKSEDWTLSHQDLYELPSGSIGRELVTYLDSKHFPMVKGYEPHGVKHILSGYEMDVVGEVRLQSYLFGNGNHTLPVVFTLAFGLLLLPEQLFTFYKDYRRGQQTKSLFYLDYAALVKEDTRTIQKALNIVDRPCQNSSVGHLLLATLRVLLFRLTTH